ncbi:hypothetical protein BKA70DRAFT_469072 [Coprinopsis sp. MPI-PUGE-AT-0042]|nr:hypothetical protein BKA70DRAFT_469072 [Coprinopsis sp. MPI-PUGE-AT-0042]
MERDGYTSVPIETSSRNHSIVNSAADFLLLMVPLHSLVVLQDHRLRTRLMMIFSTCIVTAVVSVMHAVFILTSDGPEVIIVALVESSVALVVCNVPVIATSIFDLSATSAARSASNQSESQPRFTVHFISASTPSTVTITYQVPSSNLSMPSALLISEPYTLQYGARIRNLNSRPSSVFLKPEDALNVPNRSNRLSSP